MQSLLLFCWFVQHFRHRCYNSFLTLIIHLKEIAVTEAADTHKYSLTNEVSRFFLIVPLFSFES